jgi:hypothetical protein
MLAKNNWLTKCRQGKFDLVINQFETARDLNSFVPKGTT